jgi:hypothetical protein
VSVRTMHVVARGTFWAAPLDSGIMGRGDHIEIAVIGAGGIGSRHLQSLRGLPSEARIQVVEPSPAALDLARRRWGAALGEADHEMKIWRSVDQIEGPLDVAIVATNSDVRRQVTERLLERIPVQHLVLEKFLFQAPSDYERASELVRNTETAAWVNTARRLWPVYRDLKDWLDTDGPIALSITATLPDGLGSNTVHFVDLFRYLTGRPITLMDGSLLQPCENERRPGHIEFSGVVTGRSDLGDHFSFTSLPKAGAPLLVSITTGKKHVILNESRGLLLAASQSAGWAWQSSDFTVPLQSQLTQIFAKQLISKGTCPLPTLDEASQSHLVLLKAFLASYRDHVDAAATSCPVT